MSRSECDQCGAGFVGIPERPIPPNTICKYCEIRNLKAEVAGLKARLWWTMKKAGLRWEERQKLEGVLGAKWIAEEQAREDAKEERDGRTE
jgi:hypothetical protein